MESLVPAIRTRPVPASSLPRKTYAVYTRCDHCGIYDRDPDWCDLCQKRKDAGHGAAARPKSESRPG